MKHLIFLAILIAALSGCRSKESVTGSEEKIIGTPHNKILYYKGNDLYASNSALYLLDIDGKENICITQDMNGSFYEAKVSPDRSKIAFTLNLGNTNTYVMNWDGSSKVCLNNIMFAPRYPVFSPEGDKLLFSATKTSECGIYRMNADGTKPERLTRDSGDFKFPVFISNGNSAVYIANIDGKIDLFSMDFLRDKIIARLTEEGTVYPAAPEISPDEKTVLYSSYTSSKNLTADIYTIDVLDFKRTKLTNGGLNLFPRFSFDGNKIVYITVNSSTCDINIMGKDGQNIKKLAVKE